MSLRINPSKSKGAHLTQEFRQSLIEHGVASGRDANCFFQSFFHTLTSQPAEVLNELKIKYSAAIKSFEDTFNRELSLVPPLDFDKIMAISKQLHPLERECVFGRILRLTYNTMVDRKLIDGDILKTHPDAIVYQSQTLKFANAFGAEVNAFMSKHEFDLAVSQGMDAVIVHRINGTVFEVNNKTFYLDCDPFQNIETRRRRTAC